MGDRAQNPSMTTTKQCETAEVTITTDDRDSHVSFTVPAYTRPRPEFRDIVLDIFDSYMAAGDSTYSPVSVADFAMYLLAYAADEPRTITQ